MQLLGRKRGRNAAPPLLVEPACVLLIAMQDRTFSRGRPDPHESQLHQALKELTAGEASSRKAYSKAKTYNRDKPICDAYQCSHPTFYL
jgi:hypothetical protein